MSYIALQTIQIRETHESSSSKSRCVIARIDTSLYIPPWSGYLFWLLMLALGGLNLNPSESATVVPPRLMDRGTFCILSNI